MFLSAPASYMGSLGFESENTTIRDLSKPFSAFLSLNLFEFISKRTQVSQISHSSETHGSSHAVNTPIMQRTLLQTALE
jgi:hypothetical protein